MVRTKKIYREHLLNGAYQLVVNDGFKHFHARNVAKQIQCSTQPIYREFKNLTEFKTSLCEYIVSKMENFFKKFEINSLESLSKTIGDYAKKNPKEFHRFFIEDSVCSEYVENYIRTYFDKIVTDNADYAKLNEAELNSMFKMFWYYSVGKSSLIAHQDRELFACDSFLTNLDHLYNEPVAKVE